MTILDSNDNVISSPDLARGYLVEEQRFVRHHEGTDEIKEVGHYETIREYENGGKDVAWIIDIPHTPAQDAYDEYETVQRYVEYPAEQLTREPSEMDDLSAMLVDHELRLTLLELEV